MAISSRSSNSPAKKSKIRLFIVLTGLAALASLLAKFVFPSPDLAPTVVATGDIQVLSPSATEAASSEKPDMIPVYLVGAVNNPGVYEVARGSYLYELVESAGGLAPDAAAFEINLASRLDMNQRIRIPTTAEVKANPRLDPDLAALSDPALIDINLADAGSLENLPGIGPATAKTIISYREKTGGFKKIEDLMKISGIKESRFDAIKDLITVGCG